MLPPLSKSKARKGTEIPCAWTVMIPWPRKACNRPPGSKLQAGVHALASFESRFAKGATQPVIESPYLLIVPRTFAVNRRKRSEIGNAAASPA